MLFEIINPSDPYTLETDSHELACLACVLLGEGQYGLRGVGHKLECPIFVFGGADAFFQENFGADIAACLDRSAPLLPEVFESVVIGKPADRASYFELLRLIADPVLRAERAAKWHDDHRSNMNDIGERAAIYAKAIRDKYPMAEAKS